jgi:beta propeller repeat protein
MKTRATVYIIGVALVLMAFVGQTAAEAAAVCARVKIEISQELALERVAFDARLVVTNDLVDQSLDNFNVTLQVADETGAEAGQLFFIKVLSLDKISAVDGTASIPANVAAEVHWMLIPSVGAGGISPLGKKYFIGGEVTFNVAGAPQNMSLMPAMITVKPQPELELDYFLPREVWADDPFTAPVEAPIPFSLGVRTSNVGYGTAPNLTIASGQPKIVENKQGLLIDFRLLGSAVNDKSVTPTLNLMMGNIPPQSCASGRWEMITTLSGKFVDFNASFTHASELGGTLTSLMKQVKAHFLTREMLVDGPGSDPIHDFLAYDDPNGARTPDTIYTSDCRKLPVNEATGMVTGAPSPASPTVTLSTTPVTGWSYTKVQDPANGKLGLKSVTRSDGKNINLLNAWINEEKPTGKQADPSAFFLNIIDNDSTGSYLFTYETPAVDTTPPVTAIVAGEPKYGTDPLYVTSTTNFLFTASDDISGVSAMVYRLDSGREEPALPFTLSRLILPPATLAGPHTISYFSTDRSGNSEAAKLLNVVVDDAPPEVVQYTASPSVITPSAPASSILAKQTLLSVTATDAIGQIAARYEVAAGTAATDADFAVLPVIRTMTGTLTSGIPATVAWNGRNEAGNFVPAGAYTLKLTATDQLGHASTAYSAVTANEFLIAQPLSSTAAEQINPSLSGTKVVWQDFRNGKWDIYLRDLSGETERNLTAGTLADQINPVISGSHVVWQERSSGTWDVVLYNLDTAAATTIASSLADETSPTVNGEWVAYQSGPAGARDIFRYNIPTKTTERVTADPRDQINPVISGNRLVWEDYRNGLADIYSLDLTTGVENQIQITSDVDNQTRPAVLNDTVLWVDQRHGNRELYSYRFSGGTTTRLSYSTTDEAQPYLNDGAAVFVDYASGLSDPNLSIINLTTKRTVRLISEPHHQEQPRLEGGRLVWQDNRSGVWQIYFSEITLPPPVATYPASEGFNLTAVTGAMKSRYASVFPLLSDWKNIVSLKAVEAYDQTTGVLQRAGFDANGVAVGTDFPLIENGALFVHAGGRADLNLGEISSCGTNSFKTGLTMASFPCLPDGYMASTLLRSLGAAAVSISRFDTATAKWVSLALKDGANASQDFPIRPGEGYLVYTSGDILNWIP